MKKYVVKIITIMFVIFTLFTIKCYAFSNDLFECDLPDNYNYSVEENKYILSNNDNRKIIVEKVDYIDINKSMWNLDNDEAIELIKEFVGESVVTDKNEKTKLGKENALKVDIIGEEEYTEMYILESGKKEIYIVRFVVIDKEDKDNEEYLKIKNTFELRDKGFNTVTIIYVVVAIAIFIKIYLYFKKTEVPLSKNRLDYIDYKNLTEEDFKNLSQEDIEELRKRL